MLTLVLYEDLYGQWGHLYTAGADGTCIEGCSNLMTAAGFLPGSMTGSTLCTPVAVVVVASCKSNCPTLGLMSGTRTGSLSRTGLMSGIRDWDSCNANDVVACECDCFNGSVLADSGSGSMVDWDLVCSTVVCNWGCMSSVPLEGLQPGSLTDWPWLLSGKMLDRWWL